MRLIETALALVTVYLLLSLVATQLSEYWAGYFDTRHKNLRAMVDEAFGNNAALTASFFDYGPIFALSKNDTPGAIPPQLFAQAFLAVLNGNKPPRDQFPFPSRFVNALGDRLDKRLTQNLKFLVAGHGSDWDGFEYNVAKWFADIGDRADGWYKKWASFRLLVVSFLLAAAVNADSFFLFRTFYADDEARIAFANLGELINEQKQNPDFAKTRPDLPLPSSSPEALGAVPARELDTALRAIRQAMGADEKLRGFGNDIDNIRTACFWDSTRMRDAGSSSQERAIYASNSDAWLVLLPAIQRLIDGARFGDWLPIGSRASCATSTPGDAACGLTQLDAAGRTQQWRNALACTSAVSVWVKAAEADSRVTKAADQLRLATDAFDRARVAIHAAANRSSVDRSLTRLYIAAPYAFQDCIGVSNSRSDFDQCLEAGRRGRLPLGWPPPVEQLCKVQAVKVGEAVETASFFCPGVEGKPELSINPIKAEFEWMRALTTLLGIGFTAILVSLGAPFWWRVLGNMSSLRLAGRVRKLGEEGSSADGTAAATVAQAPAPQVLEQVTGSADARNVFEANLRTQDITRLQNAIGTPPTGRLDNATREHIAAALKERGYPPEDELGPLTYEALTGRPAPVVSLAAGASGDWSRFHRAPDEVKALVKKLNTIFPASKGWKELSADREQLDDDLRARVVLYRFLVARDRDAPYLDNEVVKLAREDRRALNHVSAELRREILESTQVFDPLQPVWINTAIGELGITENGDPHLSDPRVLEYFTSTGVRPPEGDDTPWCGAFCAWVLDQTMHLDRSPPGDKSGLTRALNWSSFGTEVAGSNNARRGDICVVRQGDGHHVALLMSAIADDHLWLLGGNQGPDGKGGVTLVKFKRKDSDGKDIVVAIRRP